MEIQAGSGGVGVEVPDAIFGADYKPTLIHQVVTAYMAGARAGTKAQKNRSAVSGGGAKPYRQKGTGRARAGTSRSPIWRGGGTVFGPQPNDFKYKLPQKVKKLARVSVLSAKAKEEQLKILEDFTFDEAKTKEMFSVLSGFGLEDTKTLILLPDYDEKVYLASRNIKNLKVAKATDASTYDLVGCHTLLIMEGAIEKLKGVLLS